MSTIAYTIRFKQITVYIKVLNDDSTCVLLMQSQIVIKPLQPNFCILITFVVTGKSKIVELHIQYKIARWLLLTTSTTMNNS